ncbi:MAG: hypothetical protein JXA25_01475 [Anaerolineales bacterium]|nr:hypothetical protein [Anaerolineales bacterium]
MREVNKFLNFLRFLSLASFLAFLLAFFIPGAVYADDCTTDPLNAADCMRTPGFRQGITVGLGVTATAGVVVTNIIGQNVVTGGPPSKQVVPEEPDSTQEPSDSSPDAPDSDVPDSQESDSQTPDSQESDSKPPVSNQDSPQPPPKQDDSIFTFDNFKRLVDYPGKFLDLLDKYKLTPDAIKNWKKASRLWKLFPNKATADQYIKATKNRMNTTGRIGKALGWGGKALDAADAVLKANKIIDQRGYTGMEKAGAYYVEGANKVFVTMLTKNPVVAIIDQIAGDATGHNIESTIRAGEEKWHQVTNEYANNIYNADAIEAQIQTKDQGLRFIRNIRKQIAAGKISPEEGRRRAHIIYDKMVR